MPRSKNDPLLAALIAKLPPAGGEWPVDRQMAWLNLMAMAFGTVYGGDVSSRLVVKPDLTEAMLSAFTPATVRPKPKRQGLYIDVDGYARNATGKRILPSEIDPGAILHDDRGQDGDLREIIWANDSAGLNGQDITVSSS